MARSLVFSIFIVCLLLSIAGFSTAIADDIAASRDRLLRIQQRLESTELNLKQKNREARSLRNELRSVNQELRSLQSRQSSLKKSLKENELQQKSTRDDVELLSKKVEKQRLVLEDRLSSLYKAGGGGVLKLLFSGLGPAELDSQFRYTLRIVEHDRALLDGYRREKTKLNNKLSELEKLKKQQSSDLERLRNHKKVLADARSLKNKILGEVRKDQNLLASLRNELKEKSARLEELITDIESGGGRHTKDSPFAKLRGTLPWPVQGPVRIAYGPQKHPDLGTLFDSNGLEIDVAPQTPIKSLWEGRVAFASNFKGYGNLVIIDHGDGYHSLYAHASRIVKNVDERVKQGEVVAYSGYPGMDGVYLEIRQQGKSLDPENWLKKR